MTLIRVFTSQLLHPRDQGRGSVHLLVSLQGSKVQVHQHQRRVCETPVLRETPVLCAVLDVDTDSPGHKSDWPTGPSHLRPPGPCNNPGRDTSCCWGCEFTSTHPSSRPRTFLMTSICSSLHSGLFFLALTKNSLTFCSSWSVASGQTSHHH